MHSLTSAGEVQAILLPSVQSIPLEIRCPRAQQKVWPRLARTLIDWGKPYCDHDVILSAKMATDSRHLWRIRRTSSGCQDASSMLLQLQNSKGPLFWKIRQHGLLSSTLGEQVQGLALAILLVPFHSWNQMKYAQGMQNQWHIHPSGALTQVCQLQN